MFVYDSMVERWIEEDVPGFDLTSHMLKLDKTEGRLTFRTRDKTCMCGLDEAKAVFEKLGCKTENLCETGDTLNKSALILSAEGRGDALHAGWRVALNLLEYSSGIATRTSQLVNNANKGGSVMVCGTRKSFPGTRKLSQKAMIAGGGIHHRMGLGETILIFPNHYILTSLNEVLMEIKNIKMKTPEKKFGMEVDNINDALKAAEAGIDTLQVDKFSPQEVKETVEKVKNRHPEIVIAAAGGINADNAEEYAGAGADILVTSWMYFGKPADISAKMEKK